MIVLNYILEVLLKSLEMLAWSILPCLVLALIMQFLTRSIWTQLGNLIGVNRFIYISSPGVALHELSHALFCIIFRHRVDKIVFFSVGADGTLGYVNHSYNPKSMYQRIGNFFIGTAPVWGGFAAIYLLSALLLPAGAHMDARNVESAMSTFFDGLASADFWLGWRGWVWLYLVVVIAANITLSKPDIEGALDGLVAIVIFTLIFNTCVLWFYDFPEVFVRHVSQFVITLIPIVLTLLALFLILWLTLLLLRRLRR